ncbi:MAG: T9SS type A sorting domain-containing protein [Candidatus Kapaibacterium sp.]
MTDNSRRQFLKNTTLAGIALGTLTNTTQSIAKEPETTNLDCNITTLDYYGEGPFYTDNPPIKEDGQIAKENEAGQRIRISGRVTNLDCTEILHGTIVDVWHANDAGQYDNVGYNLRGQVISNEQGFYMFETILPGKYLNGSKYRPSHIHFKITPPGYPTITTQLYFEGDTSIAEDAAASLTTGQYDASHRIIPLNDGIDGIKEGTWDIVVDGEGTTTGINDLHINKGIIYSASPNPFTDKVTIKYGVFSNSNVGLFVYDIEGRQVAKLEERYLTSEKYEATWIPEATLPTGHYFVAIKINDLQVHYMKIVKG